MLESRAFCLINQVVYILQSDPKSICQNIQTLLGGFETKTGEQVWNNSYWPHNKHI